MAKADIGKRISRRRATPSSRGTTSGLRNTARLARMLDRLQVFIGKWITEGETVGSKEAAPSRIVASDVYQWAPGGQFIMHPAYGRIGNLEAGGLEVIGCDLATGLYRTYFFDSQGNVTTETLSFRDGTWIWQGAHARCTGAFTDGGRTLTARHERSDDGVHWTPSMTVTLRKVS